MTKKLCYLLLVLGVLNVQQTFAQNPVLKLKSGIVNVQRSDLKIPTNQQYNGWNYFIIQFNATPNLQMQAQLKNAGLVLMDYLPDYAYYAACKTNFDSNKLKNANVFALIPMTVNLKMAPALISHEYPTHALRKNNAIELTLKMYSTVNVAEIAQQLTANASEVVTFSEANKTVQVIVAISQIEKTVALSFVQYAEPISAPGEPENYIERTDHRSNAISTDYGGGRKYNGSSVISAIGDDGIIGPHIDYTGRINQTTMTANNGDHGDHCSGIMMGAGNLNPKERGQAWGTFLYVYQYPDNLNDADAGYDNFGIRVNSSSYSDGCNAGYTSFSQQCDMQTRMRPEMILSFSAGNQGGQNCGYYNGTDYGNITGGHKIGKNVITAAALNANDGITSYSSRGPAADGRTEPKVSAVGDNVNSTVSPDTYANNSGTSMSCPAVSGVLVQLYDCYKKNNGNVTPQSALIKAILMNTCDDLGNAGPDFVYGYGRVNAYNGALAIENNQFMNDSLAQGDSVTFTLNVPANVAQIKAMLYWHDYEGALASAPSLVNDLDFTIADDLGVEYLPLVLDPTPNATNLSALAIPNVDHLNNEEQVVIDNPNAGTYSLNVRGFNVPQGVQDFYVVYSFVYDAITVIYPIGGESVAPAESEKIRWDAFGNTGTFTVSYSTDSGSNWNVISSNVSGATRFLNWTTPTVQSSKCLVKVERNGVEDISDVAFNIMNVPAGLAIAFICPDSIKITWNAVPGALYYEASVLGTQYMDSMGTSTATDFVFTGLNPNIEHWFSVKAYGADDAKSRRALAIKSSAGVSNCLIAFDAGLTTLSPGNASLLSCITPPTMNVIVTIINEGINPVSNFNVAYQVNGGAPIVETYTGTVTPGASAQHTFATPINTSAAGTYNLKSYVMLTNDGNSFNDTLESTLVITNSTAVTLPYSENFESFTTCNTGNDCGATICPLGNSLTNVPNNDGDDIDWRVNNGGTPSTGTGPDVDHTLGTNVGKYVYTEASNLCFGKVALLVTPCIELTSAVMPVFSFYYHMLGVDMGELHVDIFSNGVWVNDIVTPLSGDQGNQWLKRIVGLSNYNGQIVNLRLRGITGNEFESDIALDDIGVYESVVGIENINQATSLKVKPNPTNGLFELTLGGAEKGNYQILINDVTGKTVINQTVLNQQSVLNQKLDLSGFNKGIYFLKLINNDKVYTKKIVLL